MSSAISKTFAQKTFTLAGAPRFGSVDELWGVGCASVAGVTVPYYLNHADIHADTAWMETMIERLGARQGRSIYLSHLHDQMGQMWPVMLACASLGVVVSTGMNSRFDAGRLEMFLRRLPVDVLFGLSGELMAGLADAGHDVDKVLARVATVVAYQDAWAPLKERGVPHWRLAMIGPMMAMQPPQAGGFEYDQSEWELDAVDGRLLLTSHPGRACGFERVDTGVKGSLRKDGAHTRVRLDESVD